MYLLKSERLDVHEAKNWFMIDMNNTGMLMGFVGRQY